MLDNFFYFFIQQSIPLVGLMLSFVLLQLNWNKILKKLKLDEYDGIQRVHENEIPRLGGLFR